MKKLQFCLSLFPDYALCGLAVVWFLVSPTTHKLSLNLFLGEFAALRHSNTIDLTHSECKGIKCLLYPNLIQG